MLRNKKMTLNEYQEKAMTTCMPSSENFSYMFLNLVGEVGEFASKVAKAIRKDYVIISRNQFEPTWEDPFKDRKGKEPIDFDAGEFHNIRIELRKELGDVMWQLAGVCTVMGWDLEDVCKENLVKLRKRKANGTIDGSGDGVTKAERGK